MADGGSRALAAAAVGGAITAGVLVLPFALVGALPNMWLAFGSFYARRDILSGNAANIWWIANYVLRAWNQIPRLGGWAPFSRRCGASWRSGRSRTAFRTRRPFGTR